MTYLSKEDIFKADDRPVRDVEVPEWGGTVRVRGLTGAGRDEYESSLRAVQEVEQPDGTVLQKMVPNTLNSRAKLASLSIVDSDGNQLFSELDVGRLGQKSSAALDRVVAAASELSALGGSAAEGELEGNSGAAESGDSGSGSPES